MSNVDKRVSAKDRSNLAGSAKFCLPSVFSQPVKMVKECARRNRGLQWVAPWLYLKKNSTWGQSRKVGGKRQEMAGFCFRNVRPGLRTPVNTDLYFLMSSGPISEAKALHLLYSCLSLPTRASLSHLHTLLLLCKNLGRTQVIQVGLRKRHHDNEQYIPDITTFLKKNIGQGWPGLGFIVNTQPQPPTGWDCRHVPPAQLSLQ